MTAHGSELAVELDPLIKEAKSRMRRRRVLIVSVVAVLLALGIALALASRPGGPQGSHPGGGVTHSGSGLTQAQAGDRAESLLQTVTLPPGARPVSEQVASAAAAAPDYGTDPFTQYEYRHAFWQAPEPLASVMDFYRHHAHTPAGFSSGAVGYGPYQGTVFDGRFVGGHLENRILVSFVPSHGATIIRVDAGVPWTVPRPPSEVLPAAVREVDIRSSVPSHRWTRHVTDPREVALIRRWFNDLNVVQPNTTVLCAADGMSAWPVQFTFRSASGGERARALVPNYAASICGEIQFTLHGERQTPLIDSTPFNGRAFVYRVVGLLGLSLGPRYHH